MLTPQQLDEFNRRGILRVPGAIPADDAEAMCGSVWDNLSRRYPFRRDRPETWAATRVMGSHSLDKSVTFEQVGSPTVCAILDDLLGRGNWDRPARWASLLVAFPESPASGQKIWQKTWDVPHALWHVDFPPSNMPHGLSAVRLFPLLAPLAHGGGGTVAVAGSHLLIEKLARTSSKRMHSADVRKALSRDYPWIKALCSRDEDTGRIERFMKPDKPDRNSLLRVVEMTGEVGDVFLMHPLMLHSTAPNFSAVPRIVLSSWVYRKGVQPADLYQSMEAQKKSAKQHGEKMHGQGA